MSDIEDAYGPPRGANGWFAGKVLQKLKGKHFRILELMTEAER